MIVLQASYLVSPNPLQVRGVYHIKQVIQLFQSSLCDSDQKFQNMGYPVIHIEECLLMKNLSAEVDSS